MQTTSYIEMRREYKEAFKKYAKAHFANRRKDNAQTRNSLRLAAEELNKTDFVQSRGL